MSPRPPHSEEPGRDDRLPMEAQAEPVGLGAALSDLPVPDHGPTFWADLAHRIQGEQTVLPETESATAARELHQPPRSNAGPVGSTPASLDERRADRATRRGPRFRALSAAAAAVALVVATAGTAMVLTRDDNDSSVRTADRPTGTTRPGPVATGPAEFSATYDGIEGWDGNDGCCSTWRLTVASDGSFRWTSTDTDDGLAYDAAAGRRTEIVTARRAGGTEGQRTYFVVAPGVSGGGPDDGIFWPDPIGPLADAVVALARAGDPRVTTGTVAGRATWHYDGPTVQDRLGGDGAPNYAIADVDQASGVLLELTTRVDELVVNRFTASDVVVGDRIDRSRYALSPPPGAETHNALHGFEPRSLDEAARLVRYDLLVPTWLPDGATLGWGPSAVSVNRDVAAATGPEGGNPPTKPVVSMTWRMGASAFTVTLRPTGGASEWDDPFGAEGMVPASRPVRLELPGRPALDGTVVVDAPLRPHLWGITGDLVVTVSGDLSPAELERVAGSLERHQH